MLPWGSTRRWTCHCPKALTTTAGMKQILSEYCVQLSTNIHPMLMGFYLLPLLSLLLLFLFAYARPIASALQRCRRCLAGQRLVHHFVVGHFDKGLLGLSSPSIPSKSCPGQKLPAIISTARYSPRHGICEAKRRPLYRAREGACPGRSGGTKATACPGDTTITAGRQAHNIHWDTITRSAARRTCWTRAGNLFTRRRARHHRFFWGPIAILCRRGPRSGPSGAPGWLPARMETPASWCGHTRHQSQDIPTSVRARREDENCLEV